MRSILYDLRKTFTIISRVGFFSSQSLLYFLIIPFLFPRSSFCFLFDSQCTLRRISPTLWYRYSSICTIWYVHSFFVCNRKKIQQITPNCKKWMNELEERKKAIKIYLMFLILCISSVCACMCFILFCPQTYYAIYIAVSGNTNFIEYKIIKKNFVHYTRE